MIVLSRSLLLSPKPHVSLSAPLLLWDNLLTAGLIEASSEADEHPATNLATDSTIEWWQAASGTGPVEITFGLPAMDTDTLGLARHNFGSQLVTIALDGRVPGSVTWDALSDDYLPADDRPILFRFPIGIYEELRLRMVPTGQPPRLAVAYAGKALVMQRGITAGHVPLDQGRESQIVTGTAESGDYLGRILTGQSHQTSAQFQNIDIGWFYEQMEPFIQRGASGPFFFAWLPRSRPQDVGYAWLRSDPKPVMGSVSIDVTLDLGGIVR